MKIPERGPHRQKRCALSLVIRGDSIKLKFRIVILSLLSLRFHLQQYINVHKLPNVNQRGAI